LGDSASARVPRRFAPRNSEDDCAMPGARLIKGTFAERYCSVHGVGNRDFVESAVAHSLYPHARMLRPVLSLIPLYFTADREFVASVGRLKRMRDFDMEVFAYVNDPKNRGFLRRVLRLRVSAGRLNSLMWSTLRDGSSEPFEFAPKLREP